MSPLEDRDREAQITTYKVCLHFLCCVTNYYKQGLCTTHVYYLTVSMSGVWVELSWVLCLASYKAAVGCWLGCILIWRHDWGRIGFRANLGCWQNSFPCSCVTGGSGFLLDVGMRPPPHPGVSLQFLTKGASSTSSHGLLPSNSLLGESLALVNRDRVLCDITSPQGYIPSPLPYSIRQKCPRSHPHSRRGDYTKA